MPATYNCIATTTLTGPATTVTFSSITNTYTDLVVIAYTQRASGNPSLTVRFNSDTGSNYSFANVLGSSGGGAASYQGNNFSLINLSYWTMAGSPNFSPSIINIMNYANTTTYKTVVAEGGEAGTGVQITTGTWRSASAITSIQFGLEDQNFNSGSIFSIYGIKAA